jgi:hypothetical protein
MTITRTELDALVAGVFDLNSAGPISKPDANRVIDSVLDYVDGATATDVGTVPTVTGLTGTIDRVGPFALITLTLNAVAVTFTDAAGSGSSGSLKIFDFVQGVIQPIACVTNLTFTATEAITAAAGDLAFVFGLGSVAANAGDGALTSTEVDIAASKAATMAANTIAVGTNATGAGTAIDGTATAGDIYLNISGSAATSDANGTITVTGTISLVALVFADD